MSLMSSAVRPFINQYQQATVEDLFVPVALTNSADRGFRRTLVLKSPQAVENLWFRAAVADDVKDLGNDTYLVNGSVRLSFRSGRVNPATSGDFPPPRTLMRKTIGGVELLVPVNFRGGEAEIVEEISW